MIPDRWKTVAALLTLLILTHAPRAEASGPWNKLARGMMNVATGWLEVPFGVARTTELDGSVAGVSIGLVRGVWQGVERSVVGAWETATFLWANYPRQAGADFYGPLLEPEFVVFRSADKP